MAQHTNYDEKTGEQLAQEIEQLISEKFGGVISDEAKNDIKRLELGEPYDYVIGWVDFCGAKIDLSRRPLLPRPITERWVEGAIAEIKKNSRTGRVRCLDIFAGSGCIGIAILKNVPEAYVDFADIDGKMLEQVAVNIVLNNIAPDRYSVVQSDIFENIIGTYDYIFSNPPYIPEGGKVKQSALLHEPHHAFLAGSDGLLYIRPFLEKVVEHVKPSGIVWMEYIDSERREIEKKVHTFPRCTFSFLELGSSCECLKLRLHTLRPQVGDPFFDFFGSERPSVNPEDWPTWAHIEFKTYPRALVVKLPPPGNVDKMDLQSVLEKRRTERELARGVLSLSSISTLLYWSAGLIHQRETDAPLRRAHPSGGSLFPLELYLGIFRGRDIPNGLYHYNLSAHALETLARDNIEILSQEISFDFAKNAAAGIWLTFNRSRVWKKYGSLSYKLGLIEAGHIGQNLCLVSAYLEIPIAPIGNGPYGAVAQMADFATQESLCYQLVLGGERTSLPE